MSTKEDNPSLTGYYSMEKFIKELKKISGLPDISDGSDDLQRGTLQTSMEFNNTYLSPYTKNRAETKSKIANLSLNNDNNEMMKSEMTKLRKENAELKFCLNNINKKFDNELKEIKNNNELKDKELKETKEIMKKNAALIELLGEKIANYEKLIEEFKQKQNYEEEEAIKTGDEKYIGLIENNKKLKEELISKETMINNIKKELNTKNEIFEEINTMKNEMETYLQTMDKLYGEIESRDGIIKQLKNDMQVIQNNYQQEINELKKQNSPNNNANKDNKNNNLEKGDEKLLNELKQSREKEQKLSKELSEIQKNYNEMKESNEKMKELAKETNTMIKTAIESRENLKKEYESAIKELIEKYEKQIKFMNMVVAKQKEEFKEKLKNSKNYDEKTDKKIKKDVKNDDNDKKSENKTDKKEDEAKMVEMMKIIQDNKDLLKQNEELKNMNEVILSKMKELPNLEQKYTDLFDTVKLLQEENHLLKEASKYSSMIELSQSKIKDIPSDTNNNNTNTNDMFEDTPKTKSKINNKEIINKNQKPKNLLLDDEDYDDDDNDKGKKENEDEIEKKKEKVPAIRQKEIIFDNNKVKNINNINMNMSNSEINNDTNSQIRIYNKKKLPRQSSPKSSKDNIYFHRNTTPTNNNLEFNQNDSNNMKSKDNNNYMEENDNDEAKEEDTENNENNSINANFNLYKPIKEGLLTFNLSKKNYYTVVPEKYDEFWESFDPETSVQYNTLEGLFLINSKKNNQLYYYSSKKNTFSALFQFTEDHSYGCLFLDNLSKNIIAIGGKNSKLVEKFSFENGNMEQLPELSTHRSKMTCCQVVNKIYCFLGISEERPNDSIVEYLDLDKIYQGWIEVKFDNQTSFSVLTGMSCVNLNDSELFIIGGLINDELPNEKLLYFNTEQNELFELNKDLPDSEDKHYLFTKNTMFNLFLNGNIISFTNIDDNNQVHILDNELKYDLYLTPKV